MLPNSKTFILTIPRNATRFNATMRHLRNEGVTPERFYGLDGNVCGLTTRFVFRHFNPEIDTADDESRWIALYVSHYLLWRFCQTIPSVKSFVILEDDVRLVPGWRSHVASAVDCTPSNWDLLFIGSCCTENTLGQVQIHDRLWKVKQAWCTHAYAVRKKALPFLCDRLHRIDAKLDIAIGEVMGELNCFAILPTVALQEGTELAP